MSECRVLQKELSFTHSDSLCIVGDVVDCFWTECFGFVLCETGVKLSRALSSGPREWIDTISCDGSNTINTLKQQHMDCTRTVCSYLAMCRLANLASQLLALKWIATQIGRVCGGVQSNSAMAWGWGQLFRGQLLTACV